MEKLIIRQVRLTGQEGLFDIHIEGAQISAIIHHEKVNGDDLDSPPARHTQTADREKEPGFAVHAKVPDEETASAFPVQMAGGGPASKPVSAHEKASGIRIIDGRGLIAMPGLVDIHVHFRDPGFTEKEDVRSGSMAAAAGGFTTVCCMPNTLPAIDCPAVLTDLDVRAAGIGLVNLFALSAMTVGQRGETLAPIISMDATDTLCRKLTGHGIAGISEDGKSLMDERLMREILKSAVALNLVVMEHAEDAAMSGGHIHAGRAAEMIGVPGIPAEAELGIIERDIRLIRETGARIHFQHISAAESVAALRRAKRDLPGLVTAETAPHYIAFTDESVLTLGAMAKMNPPLRTEKDRQSLLEGLADGTIDVIATDHAPHTLIEKSKPLDEAPFGIIGLETALPACWTLLVKPGVLSASALSEKMSRQPSALIGLDRGVLAPGKTADITLFDPEAQVQVDSAKFFSKGRNTPFDGIVLNGAVAYTVHDGRVTYDRQAD